jgi:hypothetical protein
MNTALTLNGTRSNFTIWNVGKEFNFGSQIDEREDAWSWVGRSGPSGGEKITSLRWESNLRIRREYTFLIEQ